MDAKAIVRELVESTVVSRKGATNVSDDEPLLESGLIDSMGIFQLVTSLEEACGVTIGDDEVVPENFSSIDAITALVNQKSRE